MNILITGASGFVGTNLVKHFVRAGYVVDVLDLGAPVAPGIRNYFHWERLNGIDFNMYDAVIHLAGMAHDVRGKVDEQKYIDVNYGLTKEIFVKFLDSQSANFIFFSSVKAVADRVVGDVLTEDVVPAPVGPYGKSKQMAEHYILSALRVVEDRMTYKRAYVLRPCMIHGAGNKGNLNLLYKVVKWGLPWPLGAFPNLRSFTSVGNLCFLVDKVACGDIPSGVYNVADDVPVSTNRLVELMYGSRGMRPRIWRLSPGFVRGLARVGDALHLPLNSVRLQKLTENYVVSNFKIKRALGIDSLPVGAEDGIMETLDSFKG
jgi:nucleoside-diphosphate-sugar epimerase